MLMKTSIHSRIPRKQKGIPSEAFGWPVEVNLYRDTKDAHDHRCRSHASGINEIKVQNS